MQKRTNEQWIHDLKAEGYPRETALADLRQVILKGLPYALSKWLPSSDPRYPPLADEVAQETLLRVIDRLETFEGRSQFSTWVQKIAVRIALTELRRRRWENVSLDQLVDREESPSLIGLMMDPQAVSPESMVEGADLIQRLGRIIMEELTEKQRRAMIAVAVKGMPLEEVARRMNTNRNALYKLMHDTRFRLKAKMEEEGISLTDILSAFERR
jgi:RNA polymerase sigma-70 factor (ECF subfamily)